MNASLRLVKHIYFSDSILGLEVLNRVAPFKQGAMVNGYHSINS